MDTKEFYSSIQAELTEQGFKVSRDDVKRLMDACFLAIAGQMNAHDEKIVLPGLGFFKRVDEKPRTRRNPRTGEQFQVPAKSRYKFCMSKGLKGAVVSPKALFELPSDPETEVQA